MSDLEQQAAAALKSKITGSPIDGTVKFAFEEGGAVRIVGGEVETGDGEADCTISASAETFQDMIAGELDPTAAYMTGKIQIEGDMGVAMKLSSLLG